jgi:hypothetical protein
MWQPTLSICVTIEMHFTFFNSYGFLPLLLASLWPGARSDLLRQVVVWGGRRFSIILVVEGVVMYN